ncbi:MAG: 2,3-bisphosphoglycerate-independent phosphoglycerate mutase [Alphaproteobacteria bacterium]|nr:2,3-bisphosphoglycerate-independent phosphoglycerate mutase [Alphaproteobacteria bacterium]
MLTPTAPRRPKPVVLCILDGWGHRAEPADDNAILKARTPNLDRLAKASPVSYLDASELHVGLPKGQMGNSEVGHMNLGAGRVVMQDLPRIDQAIEDGALATMPPLLRFIDRLKASRGTCHLMGLLSPGGVHSHQNHMAALAKAVAAAGVPVAVHAFLDGRDTPPKSADAFLLRFLADSGARIATVAGRYFAMDRDKRWDRVEAAWKTIVLAEGDRVQEARSAVTAAYAAGKSDEFVPPTVVAGYAGMADGDGILMANFRADRAREILAALLDPDFAGFPRPRRPKLAAALGLTEYSTDLNRFLDTLFAPIALTHTLGEIVADAGLKQLRIAETEKYAHVTFFFNGGEEREFAGETRILVPSPEVATYDLKPEMSAPEVTEKLVEAIRSGAFDLIVANYANTDMVGHTGDISAAIKAVEAVDICLGRVAGTLEAAGGVMLVTADHGNAEQMRDHGTGQAHTAHTLNLVPAMLIGVDRGTRLAGGKLADVAPTLLEVMGLPKPVAMTGRSLLRRPAEHRAAD